MSAQSYLKYLQNKFPVPSSMMGEYERVSAEFGSAGEKLKSVLWDNNLLNSIDIAFGVLPTFDRNAWAIKSPTGGYVICIDYLLPSALRMVSRAITEMLACADDMDRLALDSLNHNRGLWLAVKWFIERDTKYQAAWVDWQNSLSALAGEFEALNNGLAGLQLDFIIMHELQHILCGHLEENVTRSISQAIERQTASYLEVLQRNHEQELEADTEAAIFFAKHTSGISGGAFSGCEIFFVFLHAIEQYLGISDTKNSHPNAAIRLAAIRNAYDNYTGGIQGIGKRLRHIIGAYFELGFEIGNIYEKDNTILLDSNNSQQMQEDYIESVTRGMELTHVTISGDYNASILGSISSLAKDMLQGMENVHLGAMVKEDANKLCPYRSMPQKMIIFIASICAILTSIWAIKKHAFPHEAVSLEIFTKILQEQLENQGTGSAITFNIEDYPGDLPIAGDFCKITIKDKEQGDSVILEIAVMAATFSVIAKMN